MRKRRSTEGCSDWIPNSCLLDAARRLVECAFDGGEDPLAGLEIGRAGGCEQALLDGVADAQHASLQLPSRRRQVDAADTAVALVLAASDRSCAP